MAELFTLPARATDANGETLSGAKLYSYATGTTTPQPVYSSPALTVPHPNPVVADSGGKFPAVYLDPTLTYRLVCKTSDGATTLYDIDPVGSNLGGANGSASVGFVQSGTGAVRRSVQDKARERVCIDDFGAVGDGTTNDATALVAACTYLGTTGGIVELAQTKTYAILSNVTIPPNVIVRHGAGRRGNPGHDWSTGAIASQPCIRLSGTASITMSPNSGLEAIVIRSGMTIPVQNASAYTGTAIKLSAGGCNDVTLRVLVIGFACCVDGSNGGDRQDWEIEADGNPSTGSGSVIIGPSADSSRFRVRTYPWGTVAYPTSPSNTRTGMGTQILLGLQDDSRFDLMDYGHAIGIESKANGNCHFSHIWTDNNATSGLDLYGTDRSTFGTVWAYTSPFGVRFLGNGTFHFGTLLIDGSGVTGSQGIWANTAISPRITIESLTIIGAVSWGVSINSATTRLHIGSAHLEGINGGAAPYIVGPAGWTSDQVTIGRVIYTDLAAGLSLIGGNNQAFPSIASAGNLLLPVAYDHFLVTGTTNITSIGGTWNDRRIILNFAGVLTVTNGAGLRLVGGANFVTAAGSSMGLYYDQANSRWVEQWRN